jgi:diadenosine tetraphosphate (Ap4A) HIT family hydrolase
MTEEEAVELGKLIRQVSIILKEEVGCAKTYVVQFAEAEGHPHVHFHIIPRMADQPSEFRGPRIFQKLGVPEEARVSEDVMNALAERVRRKLIPLA